MNKMIETERLILKEFTTADSSFIIHLLNTPGWLKYIGNRHVSSLEDAGTYLSNGPIRSYADNGFGLWLIEIKNTGTPIGTCGLIKRPGLEDVDIGFALLPEYEGAGFAYEAASATLSYAKEAGIERVVAITVKYNDRSIALLKKLGFEFEEVITIPGDDEELMLFGKKIIHP